MSSLVLESKWNAVTQLERTTKVDAGVGGDGPMNVTPKGLSNRGEFLKDAMQPLATVAALKALDTAALTALAGGHSGGTQFGGEVLAFGLTKADGTDADVLKLRKWAMQRFGVTV